MGEYVLHLAAEENITLSPAVVNRLLDGDNGDAALLYLCLLKNRGSGTSERMCAQLKWDALRLRRAEEALAAMGLVGAPKACAEEVPAAPLTPEQRPNYSREDIVNKLERDATFASLLREVERKLGSLSASSAGASSSARSPPCVRSSRRAMPGRAASFSRLRRRRHICSAKRKSERTSATIWRRSASAAADLLPARRSILPAGRRWVSPPKRLPLRLIRRCFAAVNSGGHTATAF